MPQESRFTSSSAIYLVTADALLKTVDGVCPLPSMIEELLQLAAGNLYTQELVEFIGRGDLFITARSPVARYFL